MSDIFLYVSSCIQWNIIKNMIKKKENKGKRKKGRKGHTAVDTEDSVFRLCRRECRDSTVGSSTVRFFQKFKWVSFLFRPSMSKRSFSFNTIRGYCSRGYYCRNEFNRVNFGLNWTRKNAKLNEENVCSRRVWSINPPIRIYFQLFSPGFRNLKT